MPQCNNAYLLSLGNSRNDPWRNIRSGTGLGRSTQESAVETEATHEFAGSTSLIA